jgi:hypothetical protein
MQHGPRRHDDNTVAVNLGSAIDQQRHCTSGGRREHQHDQRVAADVDSTGLAGGAPQTRVGDHGRHGQQMRTVVASRDEIAPRIFGELVWQIFQGDGDAHAFTLLGETGDAQPKILHGDGTVSNGSGSTAAPPRG